MEGITAELVLWYWRKRIRISFCRTAS